MKKIIYMLLFIMFSCQQTEKESFEGKYLNTDGKSYDFSLLKDNNDTYTMKMVTEDNVSYTEWKVIKEENAFSLVNVQTNASLKSSNSGLLVLRNNMGQEITFKKE